MGARAETRDRLAATLGHAFADPGLLDRALTHASLLEGRPRGGKDNEGLEFLGDRVLGLLVAETLLAADPRAAEGDLALRLNALVNRDACAAAARRMGLGEALRLSPAEARSGGRDKPTILADACEAVMAALYLDGGLPAAREVFLRFWEPALAGEARATAPPGKDPKTELQERAQGSGRGAPVYRVVAREGPDHQPVFTVEAEIAGAAPARARGPSRQAAEKAAARALIDQAFP